MNSKIIAGIVVLTVGVIVLVVLTTLGGVAKKTIHNTVNSRLEYELPDGYKTNPNFEHCYHNERATFDEEYYMWNLTNLADVLEGGSPNYNLTGPFSYTEWYCEYDHKIDEKAGILTYRRYSQGYHYVPRSEDDSAMITNINPAYMGLMQTFGGDDALLSYFGVSNALTTIVDILGDSSTHQSVRIGAVPLVLSGLNQQIIATGVGNQLITYLGAMDVTTFFTNGTRFGPANSFPGWTTYVDRLSSTTLTTQTQQTLYNAWFNASNPMGIMLFLVGASSNITIATQTGLSDAQAIATLQYLNTITTPVVAGVRSSVYNDWANKNETANNPYPSGWQLPIATGISSATVAALFDATKPCNLVNSSQYKVWTYALSRNESSYVVSNCPDLTLSQTQVQQIMTWLGEFTVESNAPTSLNQILLTTWNITWAEFPYAQWGRLVAGPLKEGANLTFNPEIAAISGCQFSVEESQRLLSTEILLTPTNVIRFVVAVQSGGAAGLLALYPFLNPTKLQCLGQYMSQVLVPYAIEPVLRQTVFDNKHSGMFVTRSVRDWIFNAVDPFLASIPGRDANVGLKENATQTKENAVVTSARIYTGKNNLFWSLMPYNAGEELNFWRENVTVTGYNGSQFLTHGYVDDMDEQRKYPLNLYHKDITRPIPFTNRGKDKWNGVHVRYLSLSDDALQSDAQNPANFPYWAQFSGVVNKTSSVGLPIFLSTPNFQSADPAFYPDVTLTDLLYGDFDPTERLSQHRRAMFVLVEPTLGSAVWGNLPIQINMQYKATTRYPNLRPTAAPIYWNAIGDIATKQDLDDIKTDLYANQRLWKVLIGVGVGVGASLIITGIVLVAHFRKHENELKESSG